MNLSLIVGGEEVPNASAVFPAFVWSGLAADGWGCGAALVHSDIVISAAHCAVSWINNQHNYVGPTWISGANATSFPTERTLIHPDYNWTAKANDIMIIKLKGHSTAKPFKYNKESSFPQVNSTATVIGFGWVKESGGPFSNILKKVDIEIFPFQVCNQTYKNSPFQLSDEMHVCAGTWSGGKDGCASDSGTPLFVGNRIIGITEDGMGCGRPGIPAYYTRVSTQARWISESICLMSDRPPRHCKKMKYHWTLAPSKAPSPAPSRYPTKTPSHHPSLTPTISPRPSVITLAPTPAPFILQHTLAPTSDTIWVIRSRSARTFFRCLFVAGTVSFAVGCLIRWLVSLRRRRHYEKIPVVRGESANPSTLMSHGHEKKTRS